MFEEGKPDTEIPRLNIFSVSKSSKLQIIFIQRQVHNNKMPSPQSNISSYQNETI